MRVLLAFDKFKDSLTAPVACDLAARALRAAHPDWTLDLCPLADGGEGFCEILTAAASGTLQSYPVAAPRAGTVTAPIGLVPLEKIPPAALALLGLPGSPLSAPSSPPPALGSQLSALNSQLPSPRLAVIEMAAASGLALLAADQRDPWHTTTVGTGELIRAAVDSGASAILLGVGGSATSDLGLGALAALGLEFLSASGEKIFPPVPAAWSRIARIAGRLPAGLPPIRIACDVTNPLLGSRGAAAIYGPQKGLRAEDLARLDHESARLGLMLCAYFGRPDSLMDTPGAGAAGGISFGLMTAASAQLLPGFDLVNAWLDVERRLAAADLVITGEGRFDQSSLSGKGPGAVAARALALGKPVHVFAGAVSPMEPRPHLSLHAITPPGTPLPIALRDAPANLAASVARAFHPTQESVT